MSQNFAYSSANNVYIPTFSAEASGALIVSYARDPKRFAVNRYTQVTKVDRQQGKYIRLNPFDQSRLLTLDGSDAVWADGADRPINSDVQFDYPLYGTTRKSLGFYVGDLAATQSAWDVVAAKAAVVASRMMNLQTAVAINAAISGLAANTGGTTSSAYNAIGLNGKWNAGYNDNGAANTHTYLRSGVQAVLSAITLNSNAVCDPSELICIMNPTTAKAIAQSNEVTDTIKQSPFGMESLMYKGDLNFSRWGLPSMLFGVGEVIVETSVYNAANPNASGTGTNQFVMPDGDVLFVARPGAIEGQMGSFSTVHGYFKEEMTVETWNDPVNRREVGSVTSDFTYVVAAPQTGYLVTGVI
jgi:hypothetical protein